MYSGGTTAWRRQGRRSRRPSYWSDRSEPPVEPASLQARLGRVEAESGRQGQSDQYHQAAMVALDAAEGLLGDYTEERSDEWVDIWLEVLIDGRTNLHNWWCEPERAIEVLARARPVAEARGSPSRKAGLFLQLATQRIIDCGGQFDQGTVVLMRIALQAAEQGANEHLLAICLTAMGEALLNNGELVEADEKLKAGLAVHERVNDPQHRAWCLFLRCLLDVRRQDVEAVRSLSRQARGQPLALRCHCGWPLPQPRRPGSPGRTASPKR